MAIRLSAFANQELVLEELDAAEAFDWKDWADCTDIVVDVEPDRGRVVCELELRENVIGTKSASLSLGLTEDMLLVEDEGYRR